MTEKLARVVALLINAYPEQLEMEAIVDEDRVVFIGTVFSIEGKYPVAGYVTLDELNRLPENQTAALALMRAMVDYVTDERD